MLMFPYIANLLAAMLLGALIGAEDSGVSGWLVCAPMRWSPPARRFYSELYLHIAG